MLWLNKNKLFNYYLPLILSAVLIMVGVFFYLAYHQATPAEADFSYYRTITVDHTKVPNTDQSNFPVLISGTYSYLATVANGGLVQNSNGYDIGFYTSNDCTTGKMAWETEKYTATDGTVVYWVKVASLSHTADTVFYLCYGNSAISTDQSAAASVWDSNYKMVLHMPDGTTLSANDSTGNGNNGTLQSAPGAVAGQVDGAADFNGSTQYINGSGPNLANSAFTISFWHKPASYTSDSQAFAIGSNPTNDQAIHLRMTSNTTFHFGMYFDDLDVTVPNMANRWNYTVVTLDGSKTQTTYWDGSYINSRTASSFFTGNTSWSIARGVAIIPEWYHGSVDEVRVSTTARPADWITTEYNNQNSPSTFYSVGTQVSLITPPQYKFRGIGTATAPAFKIRGGGSPPAFVAQNSLSAGGGSYTSASLSITPSGANRYMVVSVISYNTGADPSSVVFNTSENLTKITSGIYFDAGGRFSVWRLINPTATTANIVVNFGGAESEYTITASAFKDVNQTTPEGPIVSSFANGADVTLTPSTNASDLAFATAGYNASFSLTDYQTQRSHAFTPNYDGSAQSTKTASSPTTSVRYSVGPYSFNLSMVAFALKPVSGAGGSVKFR